MKRYNRNALFMPGEQQPQHFGVSNATLQSGDAEETRINFSDIWETIRKGKWVILITCIVVTAAITGYTLMLPPVYEADSIVSVDAQSRLPANVVSFDSEERGIYSELGVLQYNADLAERVAQALKEAAETTGAEFPVLYGEDGQMLSDRQVAIQVREQTSFSVVPERSMIRIVARSEVPEEAATIANLYAEKYEEFNREAARAGVVARRQFLEEQVERRGEELAQLESQWEAFAQNNQVVTQGQDGQRLVGEFVGLEAKRRELELQLEQEQAVLKTLRDQIQQFEPELREAVAQEQAASGLQNEITLLENRISQLKAEAAPYYINNPGLEGDEQRIAEEFPDLAEINRQIEGFEERKAELTERLVQEQPGYATSAEGGALARIGQLQSKITTQELTIDQIQSQINALDASLNSYQSRLAGIPRQTIRRQQLERKLAQQEEFYNTFRRELQSTKIAEESELGYVDQVRRAYVPAAPVSPDVKQNLILGLLLGLGFGTGLAFVRQAANNRLHKPEDVQAKGYSLIGVVPRMDREVKASFEGRETVEVEGRELSTRLIPLLNPWSPISENYRLIRTNLQYARNGSSPQVMLVTSPEQSDGKTLTAVNLAITMAQSGRRTVLVDADLRRPAAHMLLDLPVKPGMAEVLSGRADAAASVLPTEVDGLHFLPAGTANKPPAEALGSDRMEKLLNWLRDTYEVVIIDSPPVLAVSDPVLLAPQCDATLAVVSADRTQLEALRVTEKTLNAVGVPIAGIIFNRFEADKAYGYRYGYYGGEYYYASAPSA